MPALDGMADRRLSALLARRESWQPSQPCLVWSASTSAGQSTDTFIMVLITMRSSIGARDDRMCLASIWFEGHGEESVMLGTLGGRPQKVVPNFSGSAKPLVVSCTFLGQTSPRHFIDVTIPSKTLAPQLCS